MKARHGFSFAGLVSCEKLLRQTGIVGCKKSKTKVEPATWLENQFAPSEMGMVSGSGACGGSYELGAGLIGEDPHHPPDPLAIRLASVANLFSSTALVIALLNHLET